MKTLRNKDEIREIVRKRYADIATGAQSGCGCATPSCCSPQAPSVDAPSAKLGYSKQEIDAVPEGANMGLGCGNPQAIAGLKKGEVVLDLERVLQAAGFQHVQVIVKESSKEFIKDWFPGSGIEQYVRSADVQGVKP